MTTICIYFSPVFGTFMLIEMDEWLAELAYHGNEHWHYIGDL